MSTKKKAKRPPAARLQATRPSRVTRKPAKPIESRATQSVDVRPAAAPSAESVLLHDVANRRFPAGAISKLVALSSDQQSELKSKCTDNFRAVRQDLVKAPKYNRGGIECIDAAEAMVTDWPPQTAYRMGQVFQYLYRHRHGGNPVRDLLKAKTLLEREIEALEREGNAALLETYDPIPY